MKFIPPYDQVGVQPPGPWTNASPAAGTKGSIVNADVFPAVQNEILNVIGADPNLTPDSNDLTQLLQAIKYLIPKYAPPVVGATVNGGLAKDASNNFLLALLNLVADNRATPAASDVIALERAADGTTVSVTAQSLAAYTLAQVLQNKSIPQLSANTVGGFAIGPNTPIPFNVTTTAPLQAANLPPYLASISNGVITINQEGWYVIVANGAGYVTPNTPSDFASVVFGINKRLASTGGNSGQYSSGFGNQIGSIAAVSLGVVTVQQLFPGDQISLQVTASTVSGQGSGAGIAGYTNLTLGFFNS